MTILPVIRPNPSTTDLAWPLSWLSGAMSTVPLFVPGALACAALGVVVARPVARLLRTSRTVAWLLVAAIGSIVALTLTPTGRALEQTVRQGGTCDLSRIGIAPLSLLTRVDDASLNVAIFVPLGLAIALLPWTRRSMTILCLAVALPFLIELTQLLVTPLGRGCESADVVDNLTGLLSGLAIGLVGVALLRRVRPTFPRHQAP